MDTDVTTATCGLHLNLWLGGRVLLLACTLPWDHDCGGVTVHSDGTAWWGGESGG